MKHESLITRLCEASEGSAELSAEVWTALTGERHAFDEDDRMVWNPKFSRASQADIGDKNITCDLSAAWKEAERRGYWEIEVLTNRAEGSVARLWEMRSEEMLVAKRFAKTPALALCAAILAACSED